MPTVLQCCRVRVRPGPYVLADCVRFADSVLGVDTIYLRMVSAWTQVSMYVTKRFMNMRYKPLG